MAFDRAADNGSFPGALHGVRVVDLTTVVFGPYATQTLGDYGADVIKVEAPDGDSTRMTGACVEKGMAPLFLGSNRNKRSVVLDLKTAEGRAALQALIATADIFIHNIRPQKLENLGLAAEELCAANPRLIYVSLLGFGSGGPYSGKPAYDDIIQALSGAVDLNRRHAGTMRYLPTIAADKLGAQMAIHAVLAALYQRERSGRGQVVEVPMFECMVQFLMTEHYFSRHFDPLPPSNGQADEYCYPRTIDPWRRPYVTSDGHVCLMPYNDRHWQEFFSEIGKPELANDPRFRTLADRTSNIGTLLPLVEAETAGQSTAHWLAVCNRLGIPCAPVNGVADLEQDEHLRAVRMFGEMETGADWRFRYVRFPVDMECSQVSPRLPPRLGEHTEEVLAELSSLMARP
ncbi:CaiB/BaiF CoA transferase family protein [Sphingobium estronivorans]|uniref:CaiB/BaiF CoA transferase family protein n=1 Tax=Sphingobium estronivorans TaxID=1577690 RepID=UPI0019680EF6|nr:CoA transferase [Sphingobium estronivorans]